ncbi:MAG: AAA family ATPase [Akkermansiaceae bacterium]|jgi:ABC-type multidrug transport system fused ATPase/permease subunit|nr:AAA family ATPase [Akkermansiaceae bacterium]
MKTVSDSLDVGRVLEDLGELKRLVEETARREEGAQGALTTCLVAARREAKRKEEIALAAEETKRREMEEILSAQTHALEERHRQRLAWIEARYHAARHSLTDRVNTARDHRVGGVQAEILRQQEERQQVYEQAKLEWAAIHEKANEEKGQLAVLMAEARKWLRSFMPVLGGRLAGRGIEVDATRAGIDAARAELEALKSMLVVKFFRFIPPALLLLAGIIAVAVLSGQAAQPALWWKQAALVAAAVGLLYLVGLAVIAGPTMRLARAMQAVRKSAAHEVQAMRDRVTSLKEEIQRETEQLRGGLSETLRESDDQSQQQLRHGVEKLEKQYARLPAMEQGLHVRRMARLEQKQQVLRDQFAADAEAARKAREAEFDEEAADARKVHDGVMQALAAEWPARIRGLLDRLGGLGEEASRRFPAWDSLDPDQWQVPTTETLATPFGRLELEMAELAPLRPADPRFALPERLVVPLALGFPHHGSLLLEGDSQEAAAAIRAIVLRLLSSQPPGRVGFTFIDAAGLGRDLAGLMHLADYEENLIHGRIWTQPQQIEQRLGELNEHVEKVIQMYLRNEYPTITEYNRMAGTIAERYQFVIVCGFPSGFSDTALSRLRTLAASGSRCGVYLILQSEEPIADSALSTALGEACLRVKKYDAPRTWSIVNHPGRVLLDSPPETAIETRWVHRLGKASVDSNRVEVPFSGIMPAAPWWQGDAGAELRVPIGRTGATKLQELALGKGTRQHVLVAGKTGSGKSTLFHVMITNLALHFSPDEVEFYLIDFKKGVEFQCYGTHRLPHARVVAIESDREFGLSVLRRVDDELRQRGDAFREQGAQDLQGYRKASGRVMPRSLLIIDEFQEFFTEDDGTAQEASLLLDRIVRQGRAFGIHVILGSQTLGGAYTLARATLGQMVIRIALQCNEADAYLIMDDDNPAPRLLTRPGEGIYNDNAGAIANNSPFQTVWLDEKERDELLEKVTVLSAERGIKHAPPVVFEGNAPADLQENALLAELRKNPPTHPPEVPRAWLGAPNSIKGPTEARFPRQSGANLLLVGQGEERMKAMMGSILLSLAAQYPADAARFIVVDSEGTKAYLAGLGTAIPQTLETVAPAELGRVMGELATRLAAGHGEDVFLLIRDLQRFKILRPDDEFRFSFDEEVGGKPDAGKTLLDLLSEGPAAGIHVILSVDNWANAARWIPRKSLADLPQRVLFQMSAADSVSLIDTPAASKLGLHRALFHDESQGTQELFRPYAKP